jgi:hypothetical protein
MIWLLREAMRQGWKRGVVGRSRGWTVVGGLALLGYLARRSLPRRDELLWAGEVPPGQVLTVQHAEDF